MLLFVILVILLGFAIALAIAFPYIYHYQYQKKYHEIYSKKLDKICKKYNYFIFHNVSFKSLTSENLELNHVIVSSKKIFIIRDFFSISNVFGKQYDNSLLIKNKKNSYYVDNPFREIENDISCLSSVTGIDKRLFFSILIYNPSCNLISQKENNQFVNIRKINKSLHNFELEVSQNSFNKEQVISKLKEIF